MPALLINSTINMFLTISNLSSLPSFSTTYKGQFLLNLFLFVRVNSEKVYPELRVCSGLRAFTGLATM